MAKKRSPTRKASPRKSGARKSSARKSGKKGKKLTKKQKKNIAIGVAAAAAVYLLFFRGKGASASSDVQVDLQPVQVEQGAQNSVDSYRIIANQRSGMTYAPIDQGQPGGQIIFTSPKAGMFTRNFVQSEQGLLAEIK